MKSGVQSITIKLVDFKATESLKDILDNPEAFHGVKIEEEGELEVGDIKYTILEKEGKGEIGPWTHILLKVDASETPVDMLIALDTSYSMISTFEDSTRFDLAVDGIVSLLGQRTKGLISGVMTYGADWEMTLDMTNVKTLTKKKLGGIEKELKETKHRGKAAAGTALNGALEVFTVKGLNDVRAVVLLTDGVDEVGPNPLKEAKRLVSMGIHIYPFYFGEEKDQKSLTILKRIATMSNTRLFSLYNAVEKEKRRLVRASLRTSEDEKNEGEELKDRNEPGENSDESEDNADDKDDKGKEELVVPSGSELLLRELTELGKGLSLVIQQGGGEFEPDENEDVKVIKAGVPVTKKEQKGRDGPIFKRTPKIIDAIKHFIEWLKGLIW
ncbi:MAG: VWA domain-containing protein [Thermoplasmata archaeon]|nr:VWA domain-containing protein [Thermoplasmata archaeon]